MKNYQLVLGVVLLGFSLNSIAGLPSGAAVALSSEKQEIESQSDKPPGNRKALISDRLVSQTLARWCAESGGACKAVINHAEKDLVIEIDTEFFGDFKQSVTALFDSIKSYTGVQFQWVITSNAVLFISDTSTYE